MVRARSPLRLLGVDATGWLWRASAVALGAWLWSWFGVNQLVVPLVPPQALVWVRWGFLLLAVGGPLLGKVGPAALFAMTAALLSPLVPQSSGLAGASSPLSLALVIADPAFLRALALLAYLLATLAGARRVSLALAPIRSGLGGWTGTLAGAAWWPGLPAGMAARAVLAAAGTGAIAYLSAALSPVIAAVLPLGSGSVILAVTAAAALALYIATGIGRDLLGVVTPTAAEGRATLVVIWDEFWGKHLLEVERLVTELRSFRDEAVALPARAHARRIFFGLLGAGLALAVCEWAQAAEPALATRVNLWALRAADGLNATLQSLVSLLASFVSNVAGILSRMGGFRL
jgi:hypothetical protein